MGYYSNKSRGLRKKEGTDEEVAALIDSGDSRKSFRKKWAQMVQKVYNADPLECPKCHGPMRIISVIEDTEVIKKILKHLDLWDIRNNSPPVQERSQHSEFTYDDAFSQLPEVDYWTQ